MEECIVYNFQKNILVLLLIGLFFSQLDAQLENKDEKEVITKFINEAFVKGFLFGNLEAIKKGFHPGFNRLVFEKNMIASRSRNSTNGLGQISIFLF